MIIYGDVAQIVENRFPIVAPVIGFDMFLTSSPCLNSFRDQLPNIQGNDFFSSVNLKLGLIL